MINSVIKPSIANTVISSQNALITARTKRGFFLCFDSTSQALENEEVEYMVEKQNIFSHFEFNFT